ncbi:Bacteriophage head completion protein GpL [uncultured Caudovirales phage]|uniref:Bacteriophage head completion protein GpL n=1 Tax=uncultured Caudovirales phage TaxID=2100421 RepID=A0A6J5S373_9CAUD|nr:head-tail adaptor Ad1 [uncultured Caudovirales phage]CAB4202328.1 Bacteriophage head completion protein GpL [uncultured Caudovirales phage]
MNSYTGKPELTALADIENNGFFPNLAISDFVSIYRIPSELDNPVVLDRLMLAMLEVNDQLIGVQQALLALGYADLDAYSSVYSQTINGIETVFSQYQRAVFSYGKALVLQQVKTMNRKAEAENLAKESQETEAYWLKQSGLAVQWFFNKFLHDSETNTTPTASGNFSAAVI